MVTKRELVTALVFLALGTGCGKVPLAPAAGPVECISVADRHAVEQRVCYQTIEGHKLIEGDIILGNVDEPDHSLRTGVGVDRGPAGAWPGGVIPYEFGLGMPEERKMAIRLAIEEYTARTGLRFVPKAGDTDFVRIDFSATPSLCASNVGRLGGRQGITIGSGCSKGSIIHELGHTAGLWHEHTREDRDNYIVIRWENIDTAPGVAFNFQRQVDSARDLGAYDFESIMHYGPYAFKKAGTVEPTITRLNGTVDGFGQRNGLSAGDLASLQLLYPPAAIRTPSGFTVTPQPTDISFGLRDESDNEAGFKLEYGTSPTGPWNVITHERRAGTGAWIPGSLVGLPSLTTHYVQVSAFNGAAESPRSAQLSFTTPLQPPSNLTRSNLTLRWRDNSIGEQGFRIYMSDWGGVTSSLGTVGANVTSFALPPHVIRRARWYWVVAYKGSTSSVKSNLVP